MGGQQRNRMLNKKNKTHPKGKKVNFRGNEKTKDSSFWSRRDAVKPRVRQLAEVGYFIEYKQLLSG